MHVASCKLSINYQLSYTNMYTCLVLSEVAATPDLARKSISTFAFNTNSMQESTYGRNDSLFEIQKIH